MGNGVAENGEETGGGDDRIKNTVTDQRVDVMTLGHWALPAYIARATAHFLREQPTLLPKPHTKLIALCPFDK